MARISALGAICTCMAGGAGQALRGCLAAPRAMAGSAGNTHRCSAAACGCSTVGVILQAAGWARGARVRLRQQPPRRRVWNARGHGLESGEIVESGVRVPERAWPAYKNRSRCANRGAPDCHHSRTLICTLRAPNWSWQAIGAERHGGRGGSRRPPIYRARLETLPSRVIQAACSCCCLQRCILHSTGQGCDGASP